MARNILAQLVLSLQDNLSGGAKSAAASLRGVESAAARLGRLKGSKALGTLDRDLAGITKRASEMARSLDGASWGKNFSGQLQKLKVTQSELAGLARSWAKLNDELQNMPGGRRAHVVLGALDHWKRSQLTALTQVRIETERLTRAQNSFANVSRRAWRTGAAMAGAGGLAYATGRAVRGTVTQGAIAQREGARDYLGGLSAADSARLGAASLGASSRFKSLDGATLHNLSREAALSMGSVDKALALLDPLARTLVVLQSLKGKEAAVGQLIGYLRGLDTLGKNADPAEVATLLDGAAKAAGVQGAEYDPADLWATAKTAKSGGFALSGEFLTEVLPALIADQGAPRVGTALGSSTAQLIGNRATRAALAYQTKLGLRDKNGKFTSRDMFAANPFQWATEVLEPALRASGIDTANEAAVVEAANKAFSNQVVADFTGRMITQKEQIKRTQAAIRGAPGQAAAEELPQRDPFVAAESAMSQLRNAAAALAEPILPAATSALNGLAGVLSALTNTIKNDPAMAALVGGTGIAALGLGGVGAMKVMKHLSGAAALEGSAAALFGSAEALTAAAARLGAGGAVGGARTAAGAAGAGLLSTASRVLSGVSGLIGLEALANYTTPEEDAYLAATAKSSREIRAKYGDDTLRAARSRYQPWWRSGTLDTADSRDQEYVDRYLAAGSPQPSNPIDPATWERARRDADAFRRDPEGTRGRAMMAGQQAGQTYSASVAAGIQANAGQVDAASISIMDRIRGMFGAGIDVPIRPRLNGVPSMVGAPAPAPDTAPARASGGSVYAGSLYRVNEYGEEFFSPAVNGAIVNQRQLRGGGSRGGSGPITIHNSISLVAAPGDDAETLAEKVARKIEDKFQGILRGAYADYGVEV